MAAPEKNSIEYALTDPKTSLEKKLNIQEAAEAKNVENLIEKQIDWAQRNASDLSQLGESGDQNVKAIFRQKADELRTEVLKLKESLGDQAIMTLNHKILQNLTNRVSLMLSIASGPNDSVATPEALRTIATQGVAIIRGTDVQSLIYDELLAHHPELAPQYLEQLGRTVAPDTLQLLTKLHGNKDLEDRDWAVAVNYISILADDNADPVQTHLGLALLAVFKPIDRYRLLSHLPDDEKLPDIIGELVDSTYLASDQAIAFIERKVALLQAPADAEKLAIWLALEKRVNSFASRATQEKVELGRKESLTRYRHGVVGHRNSARNLFTLKGIGSTLLAINGATTVAMNVAMDISSPSNLMKNRAIALGIAEVGIGLEGSDGLGGLLAKPRELLARILGDKNAAYTEETALRNDAFNREFGRYYKEAKFYYTMADKIREVFVEKTKDTNDKRPTITMRDLGLTWEALPEEYRTEPQEVFEAKIANWAADFDFHFNIKNPTNQMETMQQMRTQVRGLPPYKKDTSLRTLAHLSY